jgi:hypothetical protein
MRAIPACAAALLFTLAPAPGAWAQAEGPPAGTGAVAIVTQALDHHGHVDENGTAIADGKSLNLGIEAAVTYGVTDRVSISVTLPYIFAKYRGPGPPPPFVPFLPVDSCFCVHSAWQDVNAVAQFHPRPRRARAVAVAPFVGLSVPSHDYNHVGEAVVGRHLREIQIGTDGSARLDWLSERLSIDGTYRYAVVERVLDIPNNRSNVRMSGTIAWTRQLSAGVDVLWQHTHGGLRFPDDVAPFAERIAEHDRLLRDDNVRLGASASYAWPRWQVSGSLLGYTHGVNTHEMRAYTVAVTRIFRTGH